MKLSDCRITVPARPERPETGLPAQPEQKGDEIICPSAGCGQPATVGLSRPAVSPNAGHNANWRVIDCRRCGRTQWPASRQVELISVLTENSDRTGAGQEQRQQQSQQKGGRR